MIAFFVTYPGEQLNVRNRVDDVVLNVLQLLQVGQATFGDYARESGFVMCMREIAKIRHEV